ncbi:MAG: hypothetical protein M5U34_07005 [Chloroflexi bacterium]|nr:hypothetical protein [Chloroflexota bacterium]
MRGWARGLALLCLAVPAMGGAYMIVPWMNFVGTAEGGFPPAVTIMAIGLIPYFTPAPGRQGRRDAENSRFPGLSDAGRFFG